MNRKISVEFTFEYKLQRINLYYWTLVLFIVNSFYLDLILLIFTL
jgi:hypothetical protein